ncbi:TPA: hypothetical protein DEP58_02485 [Patescibacteria group bacterium]|nr:MAG: hypothetical protein UU98_C0042G0008 [Parcubacteria group bacterium GW2011_GWD2_42_14]HCC05151.1 hypothetical protein [Patescibacteria group bacterium]
MGWFSKTKLNSDLQLFLSEFPTWAAVQSTELITKLETEDTNGWAEILEDNSAKLKLIDCLIGANLFYLRTTPEGALASLLFGVDFLEKSLPSLPNQAKGCFVLAYNFYEKETQSGNTFTSSLEDWYKIKIDSLDACVAFVIEHEFNSGEEFNLLFESLLPTLNHLRIQQIEWLMAMSEKWSKAKK